MLSVEGGGDFGSPKHGGTWTVTTCKVALDSVTNERKYVMRHLWSMHTWYSLIVFVVNVS